MSRSRNQFLQGREMLLGTIQWCQVNELQCVIIGCYMSLAGCGMLSTPVAFSSDNTNPFTIYHLPTYALARFSFGSGEWRNGADTCPNSESHSPGPILSAPWHWYLPDSSCHVGWATRLRKLMNVAVMQRGIGLPSTCPWPALSWWSAKACLPICRAYPVSTTPTLWAL